MVMKRCQGELQVEGSPPWSRFCVLKVSLPLGSSTPGPNPTCMAIGRGGVHPRSSKGAVFLCA